MIGNARKLDPKLGRELTAGAVSLPAKRAAQVMGESAPKTRTRRGKGHMHQKDDDPIVALGYE